MRILHWTDSWKRFGMHLGIGGLGAWLVHQEPLLGATAWVSFLVYEIIQDWRKSDASYKDVIGALVLFWIVSVVIAF